MPIRTFIALDLDEGIRDGLCAAQRELDGPRDKIKWVERQNLHVTLNFLGDVPDELLHRVCERMAEAAAKVEPFRYDVRGLIATPSHGPLRMVWGGVADDTGLMAALHDELDASLAEMGLREEAREFRPHITLARVKYVHNAGLFRTRVREYRDFDFGFQHCDEVTAYTSTLTDEGPVYAPLCHAKVGR